MKRKKITTGLVIILIGFSIALIGTGMLLKTEKLVFQNNTERDVLLRVRISGHDMDSVYVVDPHAKQLVFFQKDLKKRDSMVIKKEFLSKLNKISLCCDADTGFVNLMKKNEKWTYQSDKKNSTFFIHFSD